MIWEKKGLIFRNAGLGGWRDNSALQPTPLLIDNRIRFYVGFRDLSGISRIGFVDVDANNPSNVLKISDEPVLDIGQDGAFDEFGVVPSCVTKVDNKIYLYYAGYQLGKKVRFSVLSGLAISDDGGTTFKRYSKVPVFERTNEELLFRVPHSVLIENGIFRFWYGGGDRFIQGRNKTLPSYDVRYLESKDGLDIPGSGVNVIKAKDSEYRVGRPYVVRRNSSYYMFYGYSSEEYPYKLGYAKSIDGLNWIREDMHIGIDLSDDGWDSKMMAYPSLITFNSKTYLFYNGNDYGKDGFGYAVSGDLFRQ